MHLSLIGYTLYHLVRFNAKIELITKKVNIFLHAIFFLWVGRGGGFFSLVFEYLIGNTITFYIDILKPDLYTR